jgi:predicted nucleotidyltransferase component of viral defense system
MSSLHFNTISSIQRELLEALGQLTFGTLVGGTALSLQINHRKSYDLDFAVQDKISDKMLKDIKKVLHKYNLSQRLSSDTQYTAFADEMKITFFQDIAPLMHSIQEFDKFNLASPKDIFSSKLYVMGRRATWRDYVDVAVCLDKNINSLQGGIEEATKRYKVSQRWILDPLSYFDDLEITPIEWSEKEYTDDQIKQIIIKNIEEYLAQ